MPDPVTPEPMTPEELTKANLMSRQMFKAQVMLYGCDCSSYGHATACKQYGDAASHDEKASIKLERIIMAEFDRLHSALRAAVSERGTERSGT